MVTLTSLEHRAGHIWFDDLQLEDRYAPRTAYRQSKLANAAFGLELDRRLRAADSRVKSLLAHPGWSATNLQSTGPTGIMRALLSVGNRVLAQDAEQGALPTLYAATAADAEGGDYYGPDGFGEMRGRPTKVKVIAEGRDPDVGRTWTLDRATGQYYLHSFLPEQPDLNWWNPNVRQAFDAILRFWLDRGVDGFRIDVADRMARDPELRDNPDYGLAEGESPRTWTDVNAPRNQDWPEVHEILRGFRRTLDEYDARMAIGEVAVLDPSRLVRYYGELDDELHMAFNFAFLEAPWSAVAFRDEVATFEGLVPGSGWPDYTLSNHDTSRAVSRHAPGGDAARGRLRGRLAAMMLLTLRGTPFIYYGEEIGMADAPIAADRVVDIAGRDPARTPMQWDASPSGGFTSGRAWLPVSPASAAVNVAAQRDDPRSMLSFYRTLLQRRRSSPALRRGSYRTIDGSPSDVFAYVREAARECWLVALNFGEEPAEVELSDAPGWLRLSTNPDRPVDCRVEMPLVLEADEGVLIECVAASA